MSIQIERWDGTYSSACRLFDIAEISNPLFPKADRAHLLTMIAHRNRGFEDSGFVACIDGQIWGFAMIFNGTVDGTVKMVGAVHPEKQNLGLGSTLLAHIHTELKRHPEVHTLTTEAFESNPNAIHFIQKSGYTANDRLYWSTRSVDVPFPAWAMQKYQAVTQSSIQFMPASKYEKLRPDWDQAWYQVYSEILNDIPSTIPINAPSFDEWRQKIEPPLTDRSQIVMAIEGRKPVGSIWLGDLADNRININHTGVKKSHRRLGLSVALKIEAFALARQIGAQSVTTQNHHHNPMRQINQQLGFEVLDVFVSFAKPVDA